jgi:putative phosphoribosyl transferase
LLHAHLALFLRFRSRMKEWGRIRQVRIPAGPATLDGRLCIPPDGSGIVLFGYGRGSGRHHRRHCQVARVLERAGLGTLLIDLLTGKEEALDRQTGHLRLDIGLLAERLVAVTKWLLGFRETQGLRIGYYGASTGAAAALVSAAVRPQDVNAVVSRGGRPDLAGPLLGLVRAPTLLIVGGRDLGVLELNMESAAQLQAENRVEIVPGASHLFQEPGALDQVAELTRAWFERHLTPARATPGAA